MSDNLPLSEQFRLAAEEWVDAEAAAKILEETKTAFMSQRQTMLGDIPVNKAEQMVKASPEWRDYLKKMNDARRHANKLWVRVEYLKMKFSEWQSHEANARVEARL